ncbi:hypothetical protein [Mumia quercus]|uniref:hypothetical protein n=1 Tax=Mumia quercus TaxID=2976125 RepID=UPI0021D16BED|nr:hypothetical protein [Mumia quercus]
MTVRTTPTAGLTRGTVRTVRATTVATTTVALSLAAHLAGGGQAPGWGAVAAVGALTGAVSWRASGHRWRRRDLLAAFLLAQGAVHLLSMASAPQTTSPVAMVVAHVLAAGALVVSVRHGEQVLWSVVEALALRASRVPVLAAPRPVRQLAVAAPSPRPVTVWTSRGLSQRGPPTS